MSAKIGLISDIHAAAEPLKEALAIFRRQGVDLILCAGDIAGYGTELERCAQLLLDNGCKTILGNHDIWYLEGHVAGQAEVCKDFLRMFSLTWESTLEGSRIFAVHASPPPVREPGNNPA